MTDRFNEKQKEAYEYIVNQKKNCFITGCGGTGKSYLVKKIHADLETKFYRRCNITSTTGVSASLINGVTLHSLLGIRLGTGSYEALYKMITENKKILSRWKALDVLVIDEVSMLNIDLFEKLELLARTIRGSELPFGGVQLVLIADFLQLPPVKDDKFIFESPIWEKVIEKTIYLTEIMRQSDPLFQRILNNVRIGVIDDEVREVLQSREIVYDSPTGVQPMLMYSTNHQVDKANKKYYDRLESKEYTYNIKYKWHKKIIYKDKYLNNLRFENELKLKIGCQVMYLTNNLDNLFNGTIGIIKDFIDGIPQVLFSNGIETIITPETLDVEEMDELIMSYTQIPLKLAFAASIHKSQGSTISIARINLKNIFECGQFYVAISRVKDLNGLYLRNLNFNLIKTHPKAMEFYKNL